MTKLTILCSTYQHTKYQIQNIIGSFMVQTRGDWELWMIPDGLDPQCKEIVESYDDPRVVFKETPKHLSYWGHPYRKQFLQEIKSEWMHFTNGDNTYMPRFVEMVLDKGEKNNLDLVLCWCVHNYPGVEGDGRGAYNVLHSQPHLNRCDFTNFIVKTDLAKKTGFNHEYELAADGYFINELMNLNPTIRYDILESVLAVHN